MIQIQNDAYKIVASADSQILSVVSTVVADSVHGEDDDEHAERDGHEQPNHVLRAVLQLQLLTRVLILGRLIRRVIVVSNRRFRRSRLF